MYICNIYTLDQSFHNNWFSNIFKINKISNKKEYYLLVDEKEMVKGIDITNVHSVYIWSSLY
jgi:uncharacterized protein YrzB (UPF0473 family)